MTVERLRPGVILDRPVRPRGRCNTRINERCVCFRPRMHMDACACTCRIYGSVHGAIAMPASVRGALVTDQPAAADLRPWGFNSPLRREALGGQA